MLAVVHRCLITFMDKWAKCAFPRVVGGLGEHTYIYIHILYLSIYIFIYVSKHVLIYVYQSKSVSSAFWEQPCQKARSGLDPLLVLTQPLGASTDIGRSDRTMYQQ